MLVSNRFDATFAGIDEFCSSCVAYTSQILLKSKLRSPKSGASDNIVFPFAYRAKSRANCCLKADHTQFRGVGRQFWERLFKRKY
jgi:hypothetical protein